MKLFIIPIGSVQKKKMYKNLLPEIYGKREEPHRENSRRTGGHQRGSIVLVSENKVN